MSWGTPAFYHESTLSKIISFLFSFVGNARKYRICGLGFGVFGQLDAASFGGVINNDHVGNIPLRK